MTSALAELARYAGVEVPGRPALVTWVEPVNLGDGRVQLRSAECFYSLRHPLLAETFLSIHPLISGVYTVEEILDSAPCGVEPSTILFVLKILSKLGVLLDVTAIAAQQSSTEPGRRQMFLRHFQDDPDAVLQRLAAANVLIVGSESLVCQVYEAMRAAGCESVSSLICHGVAEIERIRAKVTADPPDLMVACADAPMRAMMCALNELALEVGLTWMHTTVLGRTALLGPIVIPTQTACYACLESRLQANLSVPARHAVPSHKAGSSGEFYPWSMGVSAQIALEATRFLGKHAPPATVGACFELSTSTPAIRRHVVLRVPSCQQCESRTYATDGW
jgi:bacteriocin biosynthesis cyclodehydratase domain-containing protein